MIQNKQLSSQCRQLLKEYEEVIVYFSDEIKKELDGPINKITVDEIALEYSKRQGMRQGIALLLQKINSYANVKD